MLGLALDPDFLENGHLYLLYVVDRHHLLYAGTPEYDPKVDEFNAATIGRVTRYTATPESDRAVVDPTSRVVLLGESISSGLPILNPSHGVGALTFGDDGTLLLSMGDSASFLLADTGGPVIGGWVETALKDGIIAESEDLGSFRAQVPDSLAGKILRIDPATGDGVPSNPFFDPEAPRSPRSRVWTLGLRNAFRISIVPGTGSPKPSAGDPGRIIYGDVGGGSREEVGVVDGPAHNLGWPLFEGLDSKATFWPTDVVHPDFENPLAGPDCPTGLRFRDLVLEEGEIACNPCDPAWVQPTSWDGPELRRIWSGWSGDGFLYFEGDAGQTCEFLIEVPDKRLRRYGVRYSSNSGVDRPFEVLVDDIPVTTLPLEPTGSVRLWHRNWFELSLSPGVHRIKLRKLVSGNVFIDRLETPDLPFTPLAPETTYQHDRALLEWKHAVSETRVPVILEDGTASVAILGDEDCPVDGDSFAGNCAVAGVMVDDERWPEEYRGLYFGDYIFGWIKLMRFDASGLPSAVSPFNVVGKVTSIVHDPASGSMIAIRWSLNPLQIIPPPPPTKGDIDGDGQVDGGDLGLQLADWGGDGPGDLNGDGVVDGADLGLLLSGFDTPLPPCPGDVTDDREVNAEDLGTLLAAWGTSGPGDLNEDGSVGPADLGLLLGFWGDCPE